MITCFVNNLAYTPLKTQTKHGSGQSLNALAVLLQTRLEFVTQTHKKRGGNILRFYSFTFIFHLFITIRSQKELYTPDFNNKRWSF